MVSLPSQPHANDPKSALAGGSLVDATVPGSPSASRSAIQNPESEIAPRTIFNAVIRHKGDLDAVANELNIDAWTIAEWAMRPEIDERLSALSKLHRFTIRRQLANALPETIDKLRELSRSNNEFISCKACCALARLAQSPEGRQRPSPGPHAPESSNTHQHAPGRIKPVPNPLDDDRFSTHSLRSGLVSPHAAFESRRITHAPFTPQGNPTSPERSGASPRSDGPTDPHASPPLDASCLDALMPSSPDASMPSSQIRDPRSEIGDPPASPLAPRDSASPAPLAPYDLLPGPWFDPGDACGPYVAYIDDIERRSITAPHTIDRAQWSRLLDHFYGPADNPYHGRAQQARPPPGAS